MNIIPITLKDDITLFVCQGYNDNIINLIYYKDDYLVSSKVHYLHELDLKEFSSD